MHIGAIWTRQTPIRYSWWPCSLLLCHAHWWHLCRIHERRGVWLSQLTLDAGINSVLCYHDGCDKMLRNLLVTHWIKKCQLCVWMTQLNVLQLIIEKSIRSLYNVLNAKLNSTHYCWYWNLLHVFVEKCRSLPHHTKMCLWLVTCKCCLQGLCRSQCHRQAAALCTVHLNWSLPMHTPAVPMSLLYRTAACNVAGQCQRPLQASAVMAHCISSTHIVHHFSTSALTWVHPCPMSKWCHLAMIYVNPQDDRAAYMVRRNRLIDWLNWYLTAYF